MVAGAWGSWLLCVQQFVVYPHIRSIDCSVQWGLRHQTGAQYTAAENTKYSVEMCSVFIVAPHVVLARWCISAAHAVVFALTLTKCCLNDSVLSSFTPRYAQEG